MEEELNYLSERLQTVENNVARDLDYGYVGEKIDDQLEEQRLLENIISALTIQQRELLKAYAELIQKDYTNHFFDDAVEESIDEFLSL